MSGRDEFTIYPGSSPRIVAYFFVDAYRSRNLLHKLRELIALIEKAIKQ